MANANIPFEKLSKKAQKELVRARRGSWGDISPVTKVVADKKKYDRNRVKRQKYDVA